jgi:cell division protein FtsL
MIEMKINDYKVQELKEKIKEIMRENNNYYLYVKDLESYGISYVSLRIEKRIYFLCSDGLCDLKLQVENNEEEDYIFYDTKFVKVQEEDLALLAATLNKRNKEKEALEKEIESLETIFESQKIRGLFAKLKASK